MLCVCVCAFVCGGSRDEHVNTMHLPCHPRIRISVGLILILSQGLIRSAIQINASVYLPAREV